MYKRVDCESEDNLEEFSYMNLYDEEEFVGLVRYERYVSITADGEYVYIYDQDIPKLIKALQAAYDYKTKGDK